MNVLPSAFGELFFIENPTVRKDDPNLKKLKEDFISQKSAEGVWMYYPWHNTAVYMPKEETYFQLRTARNRYLITEEEQKKYRDVTVGIAGLSVGSAVISALVMTGGPKTIKIADPDIIEITNLNRIKASLLNIGENKTEVAARHIWELDPFADLHLWEKGVTKEDLREFISGDPPLAIFIDEMDNIEMKIRSRILCRELRIPVVMATDNGDGAIIDVERFDLEPARPIFHGQVQEEELENLDPSRIFTIITKIIDPAFLTERQQKSILGVGKTLAGVAQLGSAATLSGAAAAFAIRQIANGEELPSGRYVIGCEEALAANYREPQEEERRWQETEKFAGVFDIQPEKKHPGPYKL